jgi:hypothetical protein
MQFFIYELLDPRNKEIRYVGKTNNPKHRYSQHLYCSKYNKRTSYCVSWIKSLLEIGLEPILEIKEEFNNESECFLREIELISEYRNNGVRLTNLTDGGEGQSGRVVSEETRKKTSETKKLKPHPYLGKKRPKYIGDKISASLIGRKLTTEHKRKLSNAKIGKKQSEGHKKSISNALTGREFSATHKKNLSNCQIGNKNHMFGKRHSCEYKKHMSEALKRYHQFEKFYCA